MLLFPALKNQVGRVLGGRCKGGKEGYAEGIQRTQVGHQDRPARCNADEPCHSSQRLKCEAQDIQRHLQAVIGNGKAAQHRQRDDDEHHRAYDVAHDQRLAQNNAAYDAQLLVNAALHANRSLAHQLE